MSLYTRSFTSEVIDVATAIKQSNTQITYWRFILIKSINVKTGEVAKDTFLPLILDPQ